MTRSALAVSLMTLVLSVGCVTEDTYKAQLAKYDELAGRCGKTERELADAKRSNAALSGKLGTAETKLVDAAGTTEELNKALADYRSRAQALDKIKERLALLQTRLKALMELGLDVTIRRNRLVISLPGDVLFDSGSDALRDDGKKVLGKVAEVIRSDGALGGRYYQVAGHTDREPLGPAVKEKFIDNWGLSLMRARRVLAYMISPQGGRLKAASWSASGYGSSDPVAGNATAASRAKNRRVELVFLPDVSEMVDLQSLVTVPAAPVDPPEPEDSAAP